MGSLFFLLRIYQKKTRENEIKIIELMLSIAFSSKPLVLNLFVIPFTKVVQYNIDNSNYDKH